MYQVCFSCVEKPEKIKKKEEEVRALYSFA